MRIILVIGLFLITGLTSLHAQKFAFVDTKYILSELPEYIDAQKNLDDLSEKWQKEIEAKYSEIKQKKVSYQKEQILLPEDAREQREKEILELEQGAKKLQTKYFGVNGELFTKRKELIEPIQEKIYKAIKELAKEKDYDFVLDKSANNNILFADPKYDKSDSVLKKIKN